jgi:hypothetical protein
VRRHARSIQNNSVVSQRPSGPNQLYCGVAAHVFPREAVAVGTEEPMLDVRRRDFIALIAGAAAAWPPLARAQQAALPLVGYFSGRSSESEGLLLTSFGKGLEEEGYTIGKNIAVEYRFSDGDEDQLPAIAADLVRRRTAVIVASGTPAAVAAKAATSTLPIVFAPALTRSRRGSLPA